MSADATERAAAAAELGSRPLSAGDEATLGRLVRHDPDPRVRAVALGTLARAGRPHRAAAAWHAAAADVSGAVRRRAAETAPAFGTAIAVDPLVALLDDTEPWVAEAAAFALGERPDAAVVSVGALARTAGHHTDPLVREAAVAALGALGHPD